MSRKQKTKRKRQPAELSTQLQPSLRPLRWAVLPFAIAWAWAISVVVWSESGVVAAFLLGPLVAVTSMLALAIRRQSGCTVALTPVRIDLHRHGRDRPSPAECGPFHEITRVRVACGPWQRLFGVGDVVLERNIFPIRLENVPVPNDARDELQSLVDEARAMQATERAALSSRAPTRSSTSSSPAETLSTGDTGAGAFVGSAAVATVASVPTSDDGHSDSSSDSGSDSGGDSGGSWSD